VEKWQKKGKSGSKNIAREEWDCLRAKDAGPNQKGRQISMRVKEKSRGQGILTSANTIQTQRKGEFPANRIPF